MIISNVDPFPAADLETNRGGRLSETQRKRLRGLAKAGRKDEFIGAVFCAGVGAVLLVAPISKPDLWIRLLAGAAFLVVAAVLVRTAISGDSFTKDLRSGRVEAVEGAIGKHTRDRETEHNRYTDYYLDVAGQSFEVDSTAFRTAPDVGIVRLYVLPRSHVVLNLERMPDLPLPAGATDSPRAAVGAAITAMLSQDPVKSAEARAELAALEHVMRPQQSVAVAPPPTSRGDQKPLAEAILGTWQSGPIAMTFMPDGTMVATMPGGIKRNGSWSIGPDGRLQLDATGRDRPTDAWVAGDVLTISENGQGTAFQRTATS